MALRAKTFATQTLLLAILLAVLYVVASTLMLKSFADIEADSTKRNVERGVDALDNAVNQLSIKLADWSSWDDTYDYIQTKDPAYVKSNLVITSLKELHLNYMLFYDQAGQLVTAKGLDPDSEDEQPIPKSLTSLLRPDSPLVKHT